MKRRQIQREFVLCVNNTDCEDLELHKVYRLRPDKAAEKDGYLRVIDESGEDYLYPASYFVRVRLPLAAEQAMAEAS
jgi:hypothetical protein